VSTTLQIQPEQTIDDLTEQPTETEENPLYLGDKFVWEEDGNGGWSLLVTDEQTASRLCPPALSPSTAKAMHGCPARWGGERVLPRNEDPFAPAPRGTSAHEVMEALFQLPAEERTRDRATLILLDMAEAKYPGDDDAARLVRKRWIDEIESAYIGLFKIEDPTKVDNHSTERKINGLPVAGVPFNGTVDRIDRIIVPVEGSGEGEIAYKVIDYKAGKVRDEHHDQLRLYAQAIEADSGRRVVEAEIYYTTTGKRVKVGLGPRLTKKTLTEYQDSWRLLNDFAAKKAYPAAPSALCGWCALVNSCPAALQVQLSERAQAVAALAPSPNELGIPVITSIESKPEPEPEEGEGLDGFVEEPADGQADVGQGETAPEGADALEASQTTRTPDEGRNGTTAMNQNQNQDQGFLREGKSWDQYIGDTLNVNSYAAMGVWGVSSWAYEELLKAGVTVSDPVIDALAETLAGIILHTQVKITGRADWQGGANTRARGVLHTFIEQNPIPFGSPAEDWETWVKRAKGHCVAMSMAAIRLHEADPREDAYLILANAGVRRVDSFEDAA
jgi:putative RecB family exonuclease